MEKLIPNSVSTSKKLVEKRLVWVKESFGEKKNKGSVKKTRTINGCSMEWEWGEILLWSLMLYGAYDISEDVLKFQKMFYDLKRVSIFAKYSVFAKDIIEKSLPVGQKKKTFKKWKTFFEIKISVETNATIATELYSRIINLVF